ncbi:hypothetical protein [Streptomyces ipomoeae]|uniref:hypothetical protein n=1 Tax=Streptomyces ipomoeae TaxID=103232 RepID=UPI0011469653|nr:hypothetical protein [Streptomyces ipomoeae]MDX2933043.1 hypothetical protein [Streptomyces ipomoeae]TQE16549.1 hypothetical protein SipoB123_40635 [Streptomyces ipomoeae]
MSLSIRPVRLALGITFGDAHKPVRRPSTREAETRLSLVDATNNFEPLAGEPNPFFEPPRPGRPWQTILPLNGYTSEAELSKRAIARLEHWFTIE